MLVKHVYGVQVWVTRKVEEIKATLTVDAIIARLTSASPKVKKFNYGRLGNDAMSLQVMMPDMHIGRVTYKDQSDADYNMKLAFGVVELALESMLQKASKQKVKQIFFPFGNDAFNSDNHLGTTAAGTPQQNETWWAEAFMKGEALFNYMMSRMLEVAPVKVMFVPGNHDPHRLFYFGQVANALYANNKNVSITNSPLTRQYHNFGRNTVCLTHGDGVKMDKIPSIMMFELRRDHPEWLVNSNTFECHMGHIHHTKNMEYAVLDDIGVTLRFFRSLTSADAWHFNNTFIGSPKGAESIFWTPNDGIFAQYPAVIQKESYIQ